MAPITGMSPSDVRASANKVLTTIAQGYTNQENIGMFVAPMVETAETGGIVIEFDDSAFEEYDDTLADGGEYQSIQFGYEGNSYKLDMKGLEAFIPDRYMADARTRGIDFGTLATSKVMDGLTLKHEIEVATMATNSSNYGSNTEALSGTSRWDDPSSDPAAKVNSWKSTIISSCGKEPNVLAIGYPVFNALRNHPRVRDQFKYTSADSITADMLARFLDISKVVVGRKIKRSGSSKVFVWGKNAVLCYTNPKALNSGRITYTTSSNVTMFEPSFAYTYVYKGHPFMKNPIRKEERDGTIYQGRFDRSAVLTGISSGYLGTTVVS